MKYGAQWQGELLLAQGWAHYPAQLVFSDAAEATVTFDDCQMVGHFLRVPSNARHRLAPSEEPLDLLYIEPTLLEGCEGERKALQEWLSALQQQKTTIDDPRMIRAV